MELVLETDRLLLRYISVGDANFILELFNSPGWIKYIGDKNIRDIKKTQKWIELIALRQYSDLGFTSLVIFLKESMLPVGIISLVKRDFLDSVDIGYAVLPEHTRNGYAYEACLSVIDYASNSLNFKTIYAILQNNNEASISLLNKLNFIFEGTVENDGEVLLKYRNR